ncbi:hypothetical protein C922_04527 [Plasmodium inui San Antonio 1]|uniref:Uncharacterized protein n=1 Tax=Plasmodium inui San Antonio 1 TaxID=1237626 RepID=W6ZWG9_9APIC|nr:hypothetical protein C922_04527 [Plasmodium inui San Antonio 1]EUD65127.1 hypothetical protein C922_04527 [Plasmodium inui San Antonio 1]
MSRFRFQDYLQNLWEQRRCPPPKEQGKIATSGICRLARDTKDPRKDVSRDDNLGSEFEKWQKASNESQKAIMICKGLEVWFNNFVRRDGVKLYEQQGGCTTDGLGITKGFRDMRKCPYYPNSEEWRNIYSWSELWSQNKYERNLRVCMDIVQILIRASSRASFDGNKWVDEKQTDLCQAVYEVLTSWANQTCARRILDEWFTPGNKSDPKNILKLRSDKPIDGVWGAFFWEVSSLVTSMQCSWDSMNQKYNTVCAYLDPKGCDMGRGEEEPDVMTKVKGKFQLNENSRLGENRRFQGYGNSGTNLQPLLAEENPHRQANGRSGTPRQKWIRNPNFLYPLQKVQERKEKLEEVSEDRDKAALSKAKRGLQEQIKQSNPTDEVSISKVLGGSIPLGVLVGVGVYFYRRVFAARTKDAKPHTWKGSRLEELRGGSRTRAKGLGYQAISEEQFPEKDMLEKGEPQ